MQTAKLYGFPFDVVILANQLKYEGKPFGQYLHQSETFKNLPLIVLSRISHRSQFTNSSDVHVIYLVRPTSTSRLYDSLVVSFKEKKDIVNSKFVIDNNSM